MNNADPALVVGELPARTHGPAYICNMRIRTAFLLLFLLIFAACKERIYTPKPRAYPKVVYPEKAYKAFDESTCPFTFDMPVYARIQKDTAFFDQAPLHPCWFDIYYPQFDGRIHCSYYDVSQEHSLDKLKKDAFEMVDWHNKRANYIEDEVVSRPEARVGGMAFNITGPAASPFQFFLTDTTSHFFRGALYFNTEARPDSLAPISAFVKEDILRMIGTFRWRD